MPEVIRCVLPFRAEFGLLVRFHVPAVHALQPDIACIEPGNEALFPSAGQHILVTRNDDSRRRDLYCRDAEFVSALRAQLAHQYTDAEFVEAGEGMPEARFIPEPFVRYGLAPDVVICPRRRTYGAQKNWDGWWRLGGALAANGLEVFAAGAPDSSDAKDSLPAAWHFRRYLDATIEAMLAAKLVIATDAGLAHLAMLCGRPLLLIAYGGGLVAPGPVLNGDGSEAFPTYWPIRLQHYYHDANHMHAPIRVVAHGWEQPGDVLAAALEMIR